MFLGDFGSQLKILIGFLTQLLLLFCKKKETKEKKICLSFHLSDPESSSGGTRQQQDGELLPWTALHIDRSLISCFLLLLFVCLFVLLEKNEYSQLPPGGAGSGGLEF